MADTKDQLGDLFSNAFSKGRTEEEELQRGLVDARQRRSERDVDYRAKHQPNGLSPRRARTNHLGVPVNTHGRSKFKCAHAGRSVAQTPEADRACSPLAPQVRALDHDRV